MEIDVSNSEQETSDAVSTEIHDVSQVNQKLVADGSEENANSQTLCKKTMTHKQSVDDSSIANSDAIEAWNGASVSIDP